MLVARSRGQVVAGGGRRVRQCGPVRSGLSTRQAECWIGPPPISRWGARDETGRHCDVADPGRRCPFHEVSEGRSGCGLVARPRHHMPEHSLLGPALSKAAMTLLGRGFAGFTSANGAYRGMPQDKKRPPPRRGPSRKSLTWYCLGARDPPAAVSDFSQQCARAPCRETITSRRARRLGAVPRQMEVLLLQNSGPVPLPTPPWITSPVERTSGEIHIECQFEK